MTREKLRLTEYRDGVAEWHKWGPYLSERSWGTVREDYSPNGGAWDYFTHDMARSKAYRWGDDGLAGISDRYQVLCFSMALWNGKDPILKERPFGLIPAEGNHGEDLKEYYFYIDSTPTHSYMKYLYKYPQGEYPYRWLVRKMAAAMAPARNSNCSTPACSTRTSISMSLWNMPRLARRICASGLKLLIAVLMTLCCTLFRSFGSAISGPGASSETKEPVIKLGPSGKGFVSVVADDTDADGLTNLPSSTGWASATSMPRPMPRRSLPTMRQSAAKIYGADADDGRKYVKDGFHRHIVNGEDAVNPAQDRHEIGFPHQAQRQGRQVHRHPSQADEYRDGQPLAGVDKIVKQSLAEADEFYADIHPPKASADEKMIQRQAFAGMMWSKQNYIFDVDKWLAGDNKNMPPPASRNHIRNQHWKHLNSMRVLSMPDKVGVSLVRGNGTWRSHTVAICLIDPDFAKEQLWFMLFEQFQHPNGQIPAYEWEFSDLNPPVHPWAVWRIYNMDRVRSGKADRDFLERCFHKLLINFAWWINKVDSSGNNLFEGGFLGLDNISLFDRSEKMPGGAKLEQSDATGWMGHVLPEHDAHRTGIVDREQDL